MSNELKTTNETSPAKPSALRRDRVPDAWIDKIFGRMEAMYGSLFLDRWRGTNLVEVKAVWASELASFADNPECFGLALKALIDERKLPPTLPEFVALCRQHYRRPSTVVAIEHRLSPDEIARNKARVRALLDQLGRRMAA